MAKNNYTIEDIVEILENGLAMPPICAGTRIRSERDLAVLLHTNRMRVRESFDRLVEKRILVRNHGSGTFVRKVPSPSSDRLQKLPPGISPSMLIAEPSTSAIKLRRFQTSASQKQLFISLWSDWQGNSPAHRAKLDGIAGRIRELGHCLALRSMVSKQNKPLAREEIAA